MPSLPSVPGVRLATPDDLYRISIVAAAAFFSSPTFQFQRPFHQDFPADTIASYYVQYEAAIKDPLCAVLVTEDTLKVDEAKHVYEALRGAFSSQPSGQQGIVGICSFQLKSGSSYIDQLQPRPIVASPAANRHDVHDLRRDQSAEAVAIYNEVTHPVKLKYAGLTRFPHGIMTVDPRHLDGNMRLSTLAVAPPYWRRGHARRLVNFCTRLADLDNAIIGVSATPHGATVVSKAGFQEQEIIRYTPFTTGQHHQQRTLSAAGFELWYDDWSKILDANKADLSPQLQDWYTDAHSIIGPLGTIASLENQTISQQTVSSVCRLQSSWIPNQGVMRDEVDNNLTGTDYLLGPAAAFQVRQERISLVRKRKVWKTIL